MKLWKQPLFVLLHERNSLRSTSMRLLLQLPHSYGRMSGDNRRELDDNGDPEFSLCSCTFIFSHGRYLFLEIMARRRNLASIFLL